MIDCSHLYKCFHVETAPTCGHIWETKPGGLILTNASNSIRQVGLYYQFTMIFF